MTNLRNSHKAERLLVSAVRFRYRDAASSIVFTGNAPSLDQRRYNRVSVEYAASLSGKAYRANGTILSLSILGCRARSASPLQKGEHVGLLITVPGYDHPLYVSRADVQWSHGNEFGMEFIHMEWEGRQRLAEIIRAIEGTADDAPAQRGEGAPS